MHAHRRRAHRALRRAAVLRRPLVDRRCSSGSRRSSRSCRSRSVGCGGCSASDRPIYDAVEALVVLLVLLVLGFSALYLTLDRNADAVQRHWRRASMPSTSRSTTLSTVGFGDIHATGQAARVAVVIQILFDFALIALAARVLDRRCAAPSRSARRAGGAATRAENRGRAPRATTPMTAPRSGNTMNAQSCDSASDPEKIAAPKLRAGFTDVLSTGIVARWIMPSVRPAARPPNPGG